MSYRRLASLLGAVIALAASSAPAAHASDRVYWSNVSGDKISFVNLDASAGGDLTTSGATMNEPAGVALDPAAGRIYWANAEGNKISFASLSGGGGGDLATTGATVNDPAGIAIDPTAGRIYWANAAGNKISYASLSGGGGGDLATSGATVIGPIGVAIDPTAGRIYWANAAGNKISYANLNGSGGSDLTTTGATVNGPRGVALDPTAGRIYWANHTGSKISYANLDGSGGGDLTTTGATVNEPEGVAIDPAAGRIYWASAAGNKISFANLNGSGGGDLATLSATVNTPGFPALLKAPVGAGAPEVTGGSATGSQLSCSQGSWAPDLTPSFLYRAPGSFAYSWSRDGETIAGAGASSYAASVAGEYRCLVSATNEAGTVAQTSPVHHVTGPAGGGTHFGTKPLVKLSIGKIAGRSLPVRIANGNAFAITGKLAGRATAKLSASKKLVRLKAKSLKVAAHATKTVKLTLPPALRRLLAHGYKLKFAMVAKVRDPAGEIRTVKKTR